MNSLRTRQLLLNAAHEYKREVESFSKSEISKQINEIKYLSAQKRVPKLTLRKEIVHLESKLKSILELEKKLAKKKSKEQRKITSLKRQITTLKNKLHVSEDKDLTKKVEKLSHLIGDYLAKCGTSEEVAISRKLLKDIKEDMAGKEVKKEVKEKVVEELPGKEEEKKLLLQKAESIQIRVNSLKHEIAIHKELETKSPEQIKEIEAKVEMIEETLKNFYGNHPEITEVNVVKEELPGKVKHNLLFEPPKPEEKEQGMEEGLPLPPPPRVEE